MILFMDDDPARAVLAYNRMKPEDRSKTIWCMTAKEAIITLQDYKDSLTAVMLDHDLEGESFVNSKREDCGMEVVRWIEQAMPTIGKIIVHTWNYPAAKQMVARLRRKDYVVILQPFWSSGWSI